MKSILTIIAVVLFSGVVFGQESFKPKKENLKIFLTAFRI